MEKAKRFNRAYYNNSLLIEEILGGSYEVVDFNAEKLKTFFLEEIKKNIYKRFEAIGYNFDLAKKLAEGKNILITGGVGTGKTFLMLEILAAYSFDIFFNKVKKVITNRDNLSFLPIRPVLKKFYSALDLSIKIKDGDPITRRDIISDLLDAPALFLDDLGAEYKNDLWIERINHVIDLRYSIIKPVALSTNLTIEEIAKAYGDRFTSRLLQDCEIITLKGGDKRIKTV